MEIIELLNEDVVEQLRVTGDDHAMRTLICAVGLPVLFFPFEQL